MNRWIPWITAVCLLASSVLIVLSLQQRKATLDEANHRICIAVSNLNVVITSQLERSKENLPKLQYFKDHPDELRDQISHINDELVAFKPRVCK